MPCEIARSQYSLPTGQMADLLDMTGASTGHICILLQNLHTCKGVKMTCNSGALGTAWEDLASGEWLACMNCLLRRP